MASFIRVRSDTYLAVGAPIGLHRAFTEFGYGGAEPGRTGLRGSIVHGNVAGLIEQIEKLMRSPRSAASRGSMGKTLDQSMLSLVGETQ